MIEVQPCCAATREDLKFAHKRVAGLTFQLMLLAAYCEGLHVEVAAEKAAHAVDLEHDKQVIADLERQLREAQEEIGTITQDRNNWRVSYTNAARSTQVADLTQRLADVMLELDKLRREQASATISNIQTEGKAA